MMLSEKSPKSLKLSGFYKLSSGLQLIWAFYSQAQERTLKVFQSFKTLPFIDNVYGENLRLQKGTFRLSPRLLLLSSPEEILWFSALRREKEVKTSWVYLTPEGEERAGAPKVLKNWG
jgi:hypothetical protein